MRTIKSKRDFERVFSNGTRANHRLVRVTYLEDDRVSGDVAFVAAKRLGNAVWRNRSKRVLREAARECGLDSHRGSFILFATRSTYDSNPHDVADALRVIVKRLGL